MIERIKDGWTPEQIGNRMIQERAKLRVCQETIYRYIYSKDGMRAGRGAREDPETASSTGMSVFCSVAKRNG